MPKSDDRGFTTTLFGRCSICKEPLVEGHSNCQKCHAHVLYIRPQPKQKKVYEMLLATGAEIPTRIGIGGSRGAAKSRTIRDAALIVASEVGPVLPGITIYIIRQIWGDVYQNHQQKLDLERPVLTQYYTNKEYTFPDCMGGPRIVFGYGDTVKDIRRVSRGPEAYMMFIDQCEAFSEEELDELHTPNRWPSSAKGGPKTVYAYNPGGPGSHWLRRVFVDRKFSSRENPNHFAFIQGYGHENFDAWFQNEEIILNGKPLDYDSFYALPSDLPVPSNGKYDDIWLDSLPEPHAFRMFVRQTTYGAAMWSKPDNIRLGDLFGRFDQFAGQYFSGCWSEDRVVLK